MSFVRGQVVRVERGPLPEDPHGYIWVPSMNQTIGELGWVLDSGRIIPQVEVAAIQDFWDYPAETLVAITEGPVTREAYEALVAQEERNG